MARIKDIVEQEKQRPDMAAARVIHLYAEGTFCHAYEWSAWLWQRFVREFKVTHRLLPGRARPLQNGLACIRASFLISSLARNSSEGTRYRVHVLPASLTGDAAKESRKGIP